MRNYVCNVHAPWEASFYICIKFNLNNSVQQLIFFYVNSQVRKMMQLLVVTQL